MVAARFDLSGYRGAGEVRAGLEGAEDSGGAVEGEGVEASGLMACEHGGIVPSYDSVVILAFQGGDLRGFNSHGDPAA